MSRWTLACLVVAASCTTGDPEAFWAAMAAADPATARAAAPDAAARRCADALARALTEGTSTAADELVAIGATATEPAQREWACRLLLHGLRHEGAWPRLASLASDHPALGLSADAVAPALRALPAAVVTAPTATVRLAWCQHATGLPIVAAHLVGTRAALDVPVVLDTAAGLTVVDESLAGQLGARRVGETPLSLFGWQGERPARTAVLPELRLGQLVARDVAIAVVDDRVLQEVGTGLRALVGWEVLRHAALELAPGRAEIGVGPGRAGRDPAPTNLVSLTEPMLRLASNGRPLLLLLDTGSSFTQVETRLVDRLGLATSAGPRETVRGIGGSHDVDSIRIAKLPLRVGGTEFELADVPAFALGPVPPGLPRPDGVLGMDVLAAFTVVIDGPAKTVALRAR
ncbi:MAG: aspartyl protease family protein [Planctomycetes bacterium]|nr:aspartyl protease family protein [Planctomycetota bacterium]